MKEVTVKLRNLRQAPRKVRRVIDVIRGMNTQAALDQLTVMPLLAAKPVKKLLASGIDAARQQGLDQDQLMIATVVCDQGPALKRRLLNSRGRSSMIKKYMSHITLKLIPVEKTPQKGKGRS